MLVDSVFGTFIEPWPSVNLYGVRVYQDDRTNSNNFWTICSINLHHQAVQLAIFQFSIKPTSPLDPLIVTPKILNQRALPKPDSRFITLHRVFEALSWRMISHLGI